MNKNVWIVCLVGAVLALSAVIVLQNRQIERINATSLAERATLEKQVRTLTKALQAEAKKPKALSGEPVGAASAPRPAAFRAEPGQPEPSAPATPAPQAAGMNTNFFGAIANMMKNPQMKEMMRAQQKLVVDQMYASLPRYLSLTAETKEKLQALLVERQQALAETGLAMMNGSEGERKKAAEESKAAKAEYDQAIKELLGEQDYEVFELYEESVPEQTHVTMFKNSLTGDESLSEEQENGLVAAMYQARKDLPNDSLLNQQNKSPDPERLSEEGVAEALKQMERLQQRYAEGAAGILSAAQLEKFRAWQEQMAAMQRAGLSMAAQMFGKGKSGAGGAPK